MNLLRKILYFIFGFNNNLINYFLILIKKITNLMQFFVVIIFK